MLEPHTQTHMGMHENNIKYRKKYHRGKGISFLRNIIETNVHFVQFFFTDFSAAELYFISKKIF